MTVNDFQSAFVTRRQKKQHTPLQAMATLLEETLIANRQGFNYA
jgi:hypothetical protein